MRATTTASTNLLAARSGPEVQEVWLWEIDVPTTPAATLYFAEAQEAVTYRGHEYVSWPIKRGEMSESTNGEIGKVQVSFGLLSADMAGLVQLYSGLEGCAVRVLQVLALADNDACIIDTYRIDKWAVSPDRTTVAWTLATAYSILQPELPPRKYSRLHCRWRYKGHRCWLVQADGTYVAPAGFVAGSPDTCKMTTADCVRHNNLLRRGTFPSVPSGRVIRV